jgi:15-cis-phytoene synthase
MIGFSLIGVPSSGGGSGSQVSGGSRPAEQVSVSVPEWLKELSNREWRGQSMEYLARHSHSFRYAAKFLPRPFDEAVANIYAFCRFTDDLVDRSDTSDISILETRLNEWKRLALAAHSGVTTGIPFLDLALHDMGRLGITFHYADELIEGVRMDLTRHRYATLDELKLYTYRVASVVGLWLTERVGQRDPEVLRHAADLGHAMQLTNILRDVGEDFRSGRLYLPLSRLATHGMSASDIRSSLQPGQPLPRGWRLLMEELVGVAESHYRSAVKGIPHLPVFFQKPVLTATWVYRDIHHAIRKNGYDNLHHRAYTPKWRKVMFGLQAQILLPLMRTAMFKGRSNPQGFEPKNPVMTNAMHWKAAAIGVGLALAGAASVGMAAPASDTPSELRANRIEDLPRAEALQLAKRDLAAVDAALKKNGDSLALRHDRLRLLHALSVSESELLPEAMTEWNRLASRSEWSPIRNPLLQAYRGAFEVVRAKHALWPGTKMRHLEAGLPALDSAVQAFPHDVEARYLRLVSCYYLPFFLGRKASVREDFAALAESLPKVSDSLPAAWYVGICRFVLTRADLSESTRSQLLQAYHRMAATLSDSASG